MERHGSVVRVVICAHQGSSPRGAGAAMLVWSDLSDRGGQSGSIGGGALEFEAARRARAILSGTAEPGIERQALGPNLGQCCGGAVTLGYERFDAGALAEVPRTGLFARPLSPQAEMPLAIRRALRSARGEGVATLRFARGWLAEPVAPPSRAVWIWGAGHVGRALASTLAPLPGLSITPAEAEHVILTYSHALDFDLCHALLTHGFKSCGLIGSASKWARFRNRLRGLGHAPDEIARISCPIGDPALGKHPQEIAISVAAAFLAPRTAVQTQPASRAQDREIHR